MKIDGGEQILLTADTSRDLLAVAPDGNSIVYIVV